MLSVASPVQSTLASCIPLYQRNEDPALAWQRYWFAHSKSSNDLSDFCANLLCLFPHPSANHYFPSWAQVQDFPNILFEAEGSDPMIEIPSGRDGSPEIPQGCGINFQFGWIFKGVRFERLSSDTAKTVHVVPEEGKIYGSPGNLEAVSTTDDGLLHLGRLVEEARYTLFAPMVHRVRNMNGHLTRRFLGNKPLRPSWHGLIFYVCRELGTNDFTRDDRPHRCLHLRRVTTLKGFMSGGNNSNSHRFEADAKLSMTTYGLEGRVMVVRLY